jgi:hypothetical protein
MYAMSAGVVTGGIVMTASGHIETSNLRPTPIGGPLNLGASPMSRIIDNRRAEASKPTG